MSLFKSEKMSDLDMLSELYEIRNLLESKMELLRRSLVRVNSLEQQILQKGRTEKRRVIEEIDRDNSSSIFGIIYGEIILDMEMITNKKINILINNNKFGQLLSFNKFNLISFLQNILDKNINDFIEIPNSSFTHIFYQKDINNNWIIKK